MSKIQELSEKIEEVRVLLHELMDETGGITNPDVVSLSQDLDVLLNEYNKSLKKK